MEPRLAPRRAGTELAPLACSHPGLLPPAPGPSGTLRDLAPCSSPRGQGAAGGTMLRGHPAWPPVAASPARCRGDPRSPSQPNPKCVTPPGLGVTCRGDIQSSDRHGQGFGAGRSAPGPLLPHQGTWPPPARAAAFPVRHRRACFQSTITQLVETWKRYSDAQG